MIFISLMDKISIGETISRRRKELDIDQQTLAALAGVGINTLVAIERGSGNPTLATMQAVLATLGLQLNITLKD